ncbi:MAG: ribonuclease H family protein [Sweet potato little leaf phytoplasma]|nr:ribonuclease H family protein [Sweet potato little leaf phytoplasma]
MEKPKRQIATTRQWSAGSLECWVLNCDASWCDKKKSGGVGWILRRGDGVPMTAGFRYIPNCWNVSWMEACAVVEGLKSVPLASPKLIIELDSIQVVHLLEGKEKDLTKISIFVEEAKKFCSVLKVKDIRHIPRGSNKMTTF